MAEDQRGSRNPKNGVVDIPSGNSNSQDLLDLDGEETLALEEVIFDYDSAGTNEAVVEIYDEPAGTAAGSLSDIRGRFQISPNERVNPDMVFEDIENDIVVRAVNGNQDAVITVIAGGYVVTR